MNLICLEWISAKIISEIANPDWKGCHVANKSFIRWRFAVRFAMNQFQSVRVIIQINKSFNWNELGKGREMERRNAKTEDDPLLRRLEKKPLWFFGSNNWWFRSYSSWNIVQYGAHAIESSVQPQVDKWLLKQGKNCIESIRQSSSIAFDYLLYPETCSLMRKCDQTTSAEY